MGTITKFISTVVFEAEEDVDLLEQRLKEALWLTTWKEPYVNGVVRYDLVSLDSGDALTVDFVPVYPEKVFVSKLRMISEERGPVQRMVEFCEAYTELQKKPEIHKVSFGMKMR